MAIQIKNRSLFPVIAIFMVVIGKSRLKRGVPRGTHRPAEPTVWGIVRIKTRYPFFPEEKMSKNTQKYTYTMTTDQYEAMKAFVEANGDRSVSSFVCRAVSFYMAYLKSKGATEFLAPVIAGTIKSEIRGVEKNLSEMIFKLPVEQSVANYITAYSNDYDLDAIDGLRRDCERIVAETNGVIDLKEAFRWQEGDA